MEKLNVFETHREEYVFSGLRFLPNKWQIEVFETGQQIPLTKIQREFLLTLIEAPNQLVSYEDLRCVVWSHEPEVDQRLIHNMHVAKSKLTGLLEDHGINSSFIESVEGEGYKLNAEIDISPKHLDAHDLPLQENFNGKINITITDAPTNHNYLFLKFSEEITKSFSKRNLVFGAVGIAVLIGCLWFYKIIFAPEFRQSPVVDSRLEDERLRNDQNTRGDKDRLIPQIERIKIISEPIPETEFLIRIEGENFDPQTVRLKVTGSGCDKDNPCIVPNEALRLYGQITKTTIEKAPLTLAQGKYLIWLENELNNDSSQIMILVPTEKSIQ